MTAPGYATGPEAGEGGSFFRECALLHLRSPELLGLMRHIGRVLFREVLAQAREPLPPQRVWQLAALTALQRDLQQAHGALVAEVMPAGASVGEPSLAQYEAWAEQLRALVASMEEQVTQLVRTIEPGQPG